MRNYDIKTILNFAGIEYEEIIKIKKNEIDQQRKTFNKIIELLPEIEISNKEINFKNICKILECKYPSINFKLERLLEDSPNQFEVLKISNLIKNSGHITYAYYNSPEYLLKLLENIETVKERKIDTLNNFLGIYENGIVEIGLFLNDKLNWKNNFDKLFEREFIFPINSKEIKAKIQKPSETFQFIFDKLNYGYKYVLVLNYLKNIDESNREKIVELIVSNVSKTVMIDYEIAVEFSSTLTRKEKSKGIIYFRCKNEKIFSQNITLKEYDSNLLSYYNSALFIKSLNFQYLTYYNILEYYFNKCYIENFNKTIKNFIITNDAKIDYYNIINIKKSISEKTEINLLTLVLKKFITLDEFKTSFDIEKDVLRRNITKDIKTVKIRLNDKYFFDDLSNHIYDMRNSIVHSKPEHTKSPLVYNYYDSHRQNLYDEVNLVKWIAEQIIEKTSEEYNN